jgi:hypothetical protein
MLVVGRLSVANVEVRARLGRDGSLPEVVTETIPGFEDVCTTVEGVVSCGVQKEQVAKAGHGRGRACPEAKVDFGRGGVCVRRHAYTLIVSYVPSGVGRRRA